MKNRIILIFGLGVFLLLITNVNYAFGYSINYNSNNNKIIDLIKNPELTFFSPDWYTKPANYAQLVSLYQTLESTYPNYIEVFKANELYNTGQATGGYDLYYVRITNESLGLHKPEVLYLGGPHGDETVGTVGMYWFTDWLMRMVFIGESSSEYSKEYLQWIIDNREIYFEVSHNPYGFDHGPQRYDGNGWDLNREADMDGPEPPIPSVWSSVNGKTLRAFVDNHTIRVGCDFHGGARMLLYPWGSTHSSVLGTSPITGYSYDYAPPDFYFFDASSLRVGDYMGDYGGDLDENSVGTIPGTVGYVVQGGISPWAYGADVEKNPVEDTYVKDETWGNYPGAGILWLSPEMSIIKNPSESTFGNDTIHYYGAEVRRFILHQTDLAQPYIKWQPGTIENNTEIEPGNSVPFKWQVNGSLVVDHTYIQWGTDPDPIINFTHTTSDNDEHAGDYLGGTGWDDAESGKTSGITYNDNIYITEPGDYYFVVKAQVDQVYGTVLAPEIYGNDPYLRMLKERTNDDYYEMLEGSDGTEEIFGQTWWYSSIIHVSVINDPPNKPNKPSGSSKGKPGQEYTYTTKTFDPNNHNVYFKWDWGDGTVSDWEGPYATAETAESNHIWTKAGTYQIKVKAKDAYEDESDWSDPLSVTMPKNKISSQFLQRLIEKIQHISPILLNLLKL